MNRAAAITVALSSALIVYSIVADPPNMQRPRVIAVPVSDSVGPDPAAIPRNGYAFYVYEHTKYRYNLELHAWKCDECWRNPMVREKFLVDEQTGTFGVNIWRCRQRVDRTDPNVCESLKKVATVRIAANGDGSAKWLVPYMPDRVADPADADNPLYDNAFRSGDQLIVEAAPGLEVHVDSGGWLLVPFVSILDRGSADPTTRPLVPRRFVP